MLPHFAAEVPDRDPRRSVNIDAQTVDHLIRDTPETLATVYPDPYLNLTYGPRILAAHRRGQMLDVAA